MSIVYTIMHSQYNTKYSMKRQQLTNLNNHQNKWFPLHPTRCYNIHYSSPINDYVQKYHCSSWIKFQDEIQFEDSKQYLKRYYRFGEFSNKIKLLSDYYRYHFQVPRIFMQGVARILQDNVDDRREIQFAIVTKQMNKQGQQDFPTINTHRGIQKHQKLIKDVQLSYEDFEQKPLRKQKQHSNKAFFSHQQTTLPTSQFQKPISRVDSMKFKGSFMVFKPKNQSIKNQGQQRENCVQQKYKKPKQIRQKEKERKKSHLGQKQKGKIQEITEKQKIKNKNNSKITSANHSLASNKGLSRSKSRTQLNLGGLKIKNLQNQSNGQQKSLKNKQKSNYGSLQNSLAKSCSKKDILCEKKSYKNIIPKKGEKINLKIQQKVVSPNVQMENEKVPKILSRKQSHSNIQTNKKMFNRAIQIKKKKQ